MRYPSSLELNILEAKHPAFANLEEQYRKIDLLSAGGYRLQKALRGFIPQRAGELPEIYRERISKFTYKPVFRDAIKKQALRMTNGVLNVSFPGNDENFWNAFRESTDAKGRTELSLVGEIFTEALKFRTVFLHVDKPKAPYSPRNRAEEQALGLNPFVAVYGSSQVINWGESDRLDWVKVRHIEVDSSDPFSEPKYKATWTFIDSEFVSKYSAFVELDKNSNISSVSGGLVSLEGDPIPHGFGRLPVVRLQLKEEYWVGNDVLSKAIEFLRLDCHKFDLLSNAYFQRTFKKETQPDSDFSATHTENPEIQPGLEYVLEVDQFEWNEPSGAILDKIFTALDRIESEIRELVSQSGASVAAQPSEQSGVSKELDYFEQHESLKAYGHVLTDVLQDVYQLVAIARGTDPKAVAVSGLDSFDVDSIDKLIERLERLSSLDLDALRAKLPATLFQRAQEMLAGALTPNLTADERAAITAEIESMATGQATNRITQAEQPG